MCVFFIGSSNANSGSGLDPAILSFGPSHNMLPPQLASGLLLADPNDDERPSSIASGGGGSGGGLDSSASDDNHVRYSRDILLALRCSTLVRPRPRYIDEAIAARRSFCRVVDLGGISGSGPMLDERKVSSATSAGAGVCGTKRPQTKTALTRGGGPGSVNAKADGEKAGGQQDKQQRRVISANASGEWFFFV